MTEANLLQNARDGILKTGIISPSIQKTLSMLGSYASPPYASEVHYPTNADQRDKEAEHFKWFMFNDGQPRAGPGNVAKRAILEAAAVREDVAKSRRLGMGPADAAAIESASSERGPSWCRGVVGDPRGVCETDFRAGAQCAALSE